MTPKNIKLLFRNKWFLLLSLLAISIVIAVFLTLRNRSDTMKVRYTLPSKSGVIGKVLGEEITLAELVGNEHIQYYELQKKLYDFKISSLRRLTEEKIISAEAKKLGMSGEEFIQQKILSELKITESEVDEFIKEKNIPKDQISDPNMRRRIKEFVLVQKREAAIKKFVANVTKKSPLEISIPRPKLEINIDTAQSPSIGSANAPIVIVEFSDLQCNDCKTSLEVIKELQDKYGKKIQLFSRFFPGSGDPSIQLASMASFCANEQAPEFLTKFRNALSEIPGKLPQAELLAIGKKINLNESQFKICLESKKFFSLLQRDVQYGQHIGIRSAPAYFINNEPVKAPLDLKLTEELIEEILERNKK
jgi:protein-disulfide isomerase